MYKAEITINKEYEMGEISPLIYGSFIEHMGRVVYGGIYDPGHLESDVNGFRKDVIKKCIEMGVTCVRYPGGNFVSGYDWRDGVGPKELRPKKRDIAWKSIETNQFGTNEFIIWSKKCGIEPIITVNLGTKGIENAVSLVEYCNLKRGSSNADLRVENGAVEPFNIKYWCLGNEMDGEWQIGYKTPTEYASLAAQVARAMKQMDSGIKLIFCGSSSDETKTYTDWERIILNECYDLVDYISLHRYYAGQNRGVDNFLAQSVHMEEYIKSIIGICDAVGNKKKVNKKINISFDEWGVWEVEGKDIEKEVENRDWAIAPSFSEQVYNMEDTLLFSSMLMAIIRHSDRVKIACQALLTNISAPIMTEKSGEIWLQPIFYSFSYMSKYGRGTVLQAASNIPLYLDASDYSIPYLDHVEVYNKREGELVLFSVNRKNEEVQAEYKFQGFTPKKIIECITLSSNNLLDNNLENHNRIVARETNIAEIESTNLKCIIQAYSWNMVRISL